MNKVARNPLNHLCESRLQQPEKGANLPVMVWIHGGAFVFGAGTDYKPDFFMDEDVVLVTLNYRLAAFGIGSFK